MPTSLMQLRATLKAGRLLVVSALSFPSGMPLAVVTILVPTWMTVAGVDIKTIGLLALVQAPYAYKFVWSPLLDRYRLPWLGRRRGFMVIAIGVMIAALCYLASEAQAPNVRSVALVAFIIAFVSATLDIVIDAYAVESLRAEEQGLAVGARTAIYRSAYFIAGALAITLAGHTSWRVALVLVAALHLPFLWIAARAPEPQFVGEPPPSLWAAIWQPLHGFFRQPRAFEIAAFLVLYKLADNLAGALVRPFLVQQGFSLDDVGLASGTIGLFATLLGTFLGGFMTNSLGVGRALWLFGFLQAVSNIGYAVLADVGAHRALMYLAITLESATTGMGTGAFGVLIMRLTDKRFSATQFALFTSIFAFGRMIAGPIAGSLVAVLGWRDFFYLTVLGALPGLVMLQRFVPWGRREIALGAPSPTI